MTEPRRRSAWSALADLWDPEHPAITRMRDALRPPAQGPVDLSGPPDPAAIRRERIADLIRRVQAGDQAAVTALRELLG